MKTKNVILSITVILLFAIHAPFIATSQSCTGHWVTNRPLTFDCLTGQLIGAPSPYGDPIGCPINPVYTALQTNTFIFDNPVNDFFIDFNALDADVPGCPRIQVKINGIFYSLNVSNLTELPSAAGCYGSVSYVTITNDGYITSAASSSNGQGRLLFSAVNASNITISTNDKGSGIVVANPCFEPLPIKLKSFKGYATSNCTIKLEILSVLESNVRNIEVQGSFDGTSFLNLLQLFPKGNDSRYDVELKNERNIFYRLKINDLDGGYTYSKTIRINDICKSPSIRIFPNPSTEIIFIENVQLNDQLIIVDMLGREVIHSKALKNKAEVIIQHLRNGLYFLFVIRKNSKMETVKFLKE